MILQSENHYHLRCCACTNMSLSMYIFCTHARARASEAGGWERAVSRTPRRFVFHRKVAPCARAQDGKQGINTSVLFLLANDGIYQTPTQTPSNPPSPPPSPLLERPQFAVEGLRCRREEFMVTNGAPLVSSGSGLRGSRTQACLLLLGRPPRLPAPFRVPFLPPFLLPSSCPVA